MKKNKGFTLVELLGVIVILIVLLTLITPKIFKNIINVENITHKEQIEALLNASKIYMNQHVEKLPKQNDVYILKTKELKDEELIKNKQILDPKTKEPITGCVKIQYVNNKYKYEYIENKICNIEESIVTTGDGLYEVEERLIYRGTNPDNYIWLDENGDKSTQMAEMYRIISYEKDGTIKVIRNNSIGLSQWDSEEGISTRYNENNTYCNPIETYFGCNAWGNTNNTYIGENTLQDTYKYKYYQNNTDLNMIDGENTGTVTQDSTLNVYLNNDWINTLSFKNNIETYTYNVGGIFYNYAYEGGDKGIEKEKEEEQTLKWNGKIALMNITDYVEASTKSECTSVYSTFYHNTNYYYDTDGDGTKEQTLTTREEWPCSNNNWLYKGIYEWTLSPNSYKNAYVWTINTLGTINDSHASYANIEARPSFYLKSEITITGNGTIENPYKIEEK